MFRVSQRNNFQKEITQEVISGFQHFFDIDMPDGVIEWNDYNRDLAYILIGMENDMGEVLPPEEETMYFHKIQAMYTELLDTEHAYTFDEFGEYLLFRIIECVAETVCDDIEDSTSQNIDWVSAFPLRSQALLIQELQEEEAELDEDLGTQRRQEEIDCAINEKFLAATKFPYMGNIDVSPLFWDYDFTIFEDFGLPATFAFFKKYSETLGATIGSDGVQSDSGSMQYPCE